MRQTTQFLSTADAARVLSVTPATVRLMAKRGDLRAAAGTESGIRLFRRADVEKLAKLREEQPKREAGHGPGQEKA